MRNKIYCSLLMIASLLFSIKTFAQDNATSESVMRSNGKIYVVVAICVTILIGLCLYIASIDKKIGKIEKENL
jgi:uncharacterized membrane protein